MEPGRKRRWPRGAANAIFHFKNLTHLCERFVCQKMTETASRGNCIKGWLSYSWYELFSLVFSIVVILDCCAFRFKMCADLYFRSLVFFIWCKRVVWNIQWKYCPNIETADRFTSLDKVYGYLYLHYVQRCITDYVLF